MKTLSRSCMPAFAIVVLSAAGIAAGDSITIEGMAYDEVYVRESETRYYVELPAEGRVVSAAKSDVDTAGVTISTDQDHRNALHRQWQENNAKRREAARPEPALLDDETLAAMKAKRDAEGVTKAKSDTEPIRITGPSRSERYGASSPVAYDSGVQGTAYPQYQAYQAPRPKFQRQPYQPRTRPRNVYIIRDEPLPKIVVRNMGGYGGGYGNQVSNISDLFYQVPDSLVGEDETGGEHLVDQGIGSQGTARGNSLGSRGQSGQGTRIGGTRGQSGQGRRIGGTRGAY